MCTLSAKDAEHIEWDMANLEELFQGIRILQQQEYAEGTLQGLERRAELALAASGRRESLAAAMG